MDAAPDFAPTEQAVYDALAALGIAFERFAHPPVFTVEEAERYWAGIPATHCKNLFLRNAKGSRHYLVVLGHAKKADLKALSADFLDLAEAKIFADAQAAARDPSRVPPGKLHCITRKDEAGHTIREYAGSMSDYLAMHTGLPPKIAKFRRPAA